MLESTRRRYRDLQTTRQSTEARKRVKLYCAEDLVTWVNDWCWTYNPKNVSLGLPSYIPFDLFPRQEEYLRWLEEREARGEEGVCEKSRDVGISWLNCCFAVHRWLFKPGFKSTFGANKADNVDNVGNPDSIFEKMRLLMSYLPDWMMPVGWNPRKHDNYMKLINPENDNVITGESGDNMGRGGRASIYFIDEAAHVERAERVDAATLAVSDCRIQVSSVNGMGNVFARKRHSGHVPVFTFHWSDDPRKDEAWAKVMKGKTEPYIFAGEYDIDYGASVEGVCIPGAWVQSARKLGTEFNGLFDDYKTDRYPVTSGLDVGGGKAKSVFIPRRGPLVLPVQSWSEPDTTETAYKAIAAAESHGAGFLGFDNIGIGAGVESVLNRYHGPIRMLGINVGETPSSEEWPDGRRAHERFLNLKAELWWKMRTAFERSHQHYLFMTTEDKGEEHSLEDLIVLPESPELMSQLPVVKFGHVEKGKIKIESKKDLARRGIASPDYAEALALTFDGRANDDTSSVGFTPIGMY